MRRFPPARITRSLIRCAWFFLSLAAARSADPATPIKVGQFASLTGKEASFGVAGHKGIVLAVEELNARGGVLGRPVEFLVEDIQSKSGESATVVKKLISRDQVVAILGGNASTNSLEAALICQQARALGLDLPIFGGDGWEAPQLMELGGQAVEGIYYSTHYSAESPAPEVKAFLRKFKARYDGEVPDAVAALGYDAMMLLADAMQRAGTTDGPRVRAALAATKDFPGVTGRTTIDAQRNTSKPAVILTVKNHRMQFVETVLP